MNRWSETPDHRYGTPPRGFLPHVPGYTISHVHDEGDCCVTCGIDRCRYVPTVWSRFKAWLGVA